MSTNNDSLTGDGDIEKNVKLAEQMGKKIDAIGMRRAPGGIGVDLSDIYVDGTIQGERRQVLGIPR